MSSRSGTEIVTAELADELRIRGHEIVIYSLSCGKLAESLRFRGIVVVDKIHDVPFIPDVIHGHHNVTLAIALTHFPNTPSIFVCHDFDVWHDKAFLHPMIKKYVAVDKLCLKRLIIDNIPNDQCLIINNAVNTNKFVKKEKISPIPKKALLLSKSSIQHNVISKVCQINGLELDVIGSGFGNEIDNLNEVLKDYDIVFATARMAIEAASCGCCVIVCDHRGFAGILTTSNWTDWYAGNLGRSILIEDISETNLTNAIAQYSPNDVAKLTTQVRLDSDIKEKVDQYEQIYKEIISYQNSKSNDKQINLNVYQYNLSAFLEDFLPSYNHNKIWFDVSKKFLNLDSPELTILKSMNTKLDYLEQREIELGKDTNFIRKEVKHIKEDIDLIRQDTDLIRQDIGFLRLLTNILRKPYSWLKKIFNR
ncbi:hypothetical protein [Pseudanabaena sp. BC1403]|uniref:glycosyltransferase n=1 Tax=Pseudanabaena sp. BC1403 TaxID=2043171 RepID=UPI0015E15C40|nr:hypothetical protein [Pseudanabaena sp. BC1403]